jgi:predicted nuclease of predicted toxin-antitoxin system
VRFLIDNALSPRVAEDLSIAGEDAIHVRDLGIQNETDDVIFDRAAEDDRILVSADTDFGTILAMRKVARPSVVIFRHGLERDPRAQASIMLANLGQVADALEQGCLVILEPTRVRVRMLPLGLA